MTIDALLEDAMKAPTELDDVDLVDDVRREIQRQPPKTARRVLLFATPLAAAACALHITALFTRAPLHVSDVERAVAAGARVPVEGDSATHTIDLQVQP